MVQTLKEILCRRKFKVVVPNGSDTTEVASKQYTTSMNLEFNKFGYIVDYSVPLYASDMLEFYSSYMELFKSMSNANVRYEPLYPNFPQQVIEASELELYFNAIFHYISYGTWRPKYQKQVRLPLVSVLKPIVLHTIDESSANVMLVDLCKELLSSPVSLSSQDIKDVCTLLKYYDIQNIEIPFKETRALICAELLRQNNYSKIDTIYSNATINDVLRLCVAYSHGDVSMQTCSKFVSTSRSVRRYIISLLERVYVSRPKQEVLENLYTYREPWIKLLYGLHIFEYPKLAPKYTKLISKFLSGDRRYHQSFNSKLERAYQTYNLNEVLNLLNTKQGVLVRNVCRLLKVFSEKDADANLKTIQNDLLNHTDQVSIKILISLKEALVNICDERMVFPKGEVLSSDILDSVFDTIPFSASAWNEFLNTVDTIISNRLYINFNLEGKKVFLDETLSNYMLPRTQRTTSDSKVPITRGSKISINSDANYIRAFVYWENIRLNTPTDKTNPNLLIRNIPQERVDLDLSAILFDSNFKYVKHISYTNLRTNAVVHSGDITNAPVGVGASEYIDMDVNKLLKSNIRYVALMVYSYTQQKFKDIPTVYVGHMERFGMMDGQIFEPRTVRQRFDLCGDNTSRIVCVYDVLTKTMTYVDLNSSLERNIKYNNVESTKGDISTICKYLLSDRFSYSMYDLIKSYKGIKTVDTLEDADIIFADKYLVDEKMSNIEGKQTITQYDIDFWNTILS